MLFLAEKHENAHLLVFSVHRKHHISLFSSFDPEEVSNSVLQTDTAVLKYLRQLITNNFYLSYISVSGTL